MVSSGRYCMDSKLEDEEDAVRLVTLERHRTDIAPGTIMVDQHFSVH